MIHEWTASIEWISQRMGEEIQASSSFSLWRALYDHGQPIGQGHRLLPKPPVSAPPTVVYVTGSIEAMRRAGTPFQWINPEAKGCYWVYQAHSLPEMTCLDPSHPDWMLCKVPEKNLRFITIGYIHPREVSRVMDELPRVAIFSTGKPEVWMRSLLHQKKVSGMVGWDRKLDANWDVNWTCSYDEFSMQYLLNDSSWNKPPDRQEEATVFPSTPFGLRLGLQRALRQPDAAKRNRLWRETLDCAIAQILDEKWLMEPAPVTDTLPNLMMRVKKYLDTIAVIPAEQRNIEWVIHLIHEWSREEERSCSMS